MVVSRPLYDQIRPKFFHFYISMFLPLKPCPSCRSRKKLQNGGIETSVRPNPTLVFSILRFHVFASGVLWGAKVNLKMSSKPKLFDPWDSLGSLLGPLGRPSEVPWTPSDSGGRVVGSHQVSQPKQAN